VRTTVRRFRGPVGAAVALVVAAGVVGVLSATGGSGYLDPDAYDPSGSRAVAEVLRDQGVDVERVEQVADAVGDAGTTLVVPRPEALARTELQALAGHRGPLVVVGASEDDLDELDLPAEVAGDAPVEPRRPACPYPAAERAGDAELGGTLYAPTGDGATGCYASGGAASLLVLPERAVLLGSGELLTNDRLDERGNAALALALLGTAPRVAWLVPDPARAVPESEQRPLTSLMPDGLVLGVVQLAVALAVLALWRARRLGRVVEEPLPVVVRAAEAAEGRGRLYRAAGAREPAAEALRAAVRGRVCRRLGLPPSAERSAVVSTAAARTGRDPAGLDALLYGSAPADDAALVRLSDELRAFERAVTERSPTAPHEEVAGP
jgi:hypothetical protein